MQLEQYYVILIELQIKVVFEDVRHETQLHRAAAEVALPQEADYSLKPVLHLP
jgi:hypothetical protein